MMKDSRKLERVFKGVANHYRIDILFLISKHKEISLFGIADNLDRDFRTISEHTKKLVTSGLVDKRYRGREVVHSLSPYGRKIIKILRTF